MERLPEWSEISAEIWALFKSRNFKMQIQGTRNTVSWKQKAMGWICPEECNVERGTGASLEGVFCWL